MSSNIKSLDGTVQLVISVEVLDAILSKFPNLTTFPIPVEEDDIPTYGLTPKNLGS